MKSLRFSRRLDSFNLDKIRCIGTSIGCTAEAASEQEHMEVVRWAHSRPYLWHRVMYDM